MHLVLDWWQYKNGLVAPIAFASRILQKYEQHYGVTELEVLGVVWATKLYLYVTYVISRVGVVTFKK